MSNIKKNFLFSSVLSLSQIIFPIITFPYVTRVLLPEGLGTVTFIDSFVQYLVIASALGIPIYGVREIARVKNDKVKLAKTYSELLIIHTILSVFFSFIFFILVKLVPQLTSEYGLCIIGIGIILTSVFSINWFYAGLEKFAVISSVSIIVRLLSVVFIFIFIKSPEDKTLYYGFNLIGNVITGLICMIIALRTTRFVTSDLEFMRHFRSLLLLFSLTVITSVYVILDSVILGFIKNNTEVGYYGTAMKLSKIPISLLSALTTVLIPQLSSLEFGEKFKNLLSKSMNFSFVLSIPISFGLFVLSKEFILIFAGELFLPALSAFKILSFIIVPIGFALISYQILIPYNKEKYMMICSIMGLVCSLILNFILVPYLGNVGSAISSLGTEMLVSVFLFIVSFKLCKIALPVRVILLSLLTCSGFFGIKFFIKMYVTNLYTIVLITGLLSTIFYFAVMGFVFKVAVVKDFYTSITDKLRI
mgnify:CR=1 FL=1